MQFALKSINEWSITILFNCVDILWVTGKGKASVSQELGQDDLVFREEGGVMQPFQIGKQYKIQYDLTVCPCYLSFNWKYKLAYSA